MLSCDRCPPLWQNWTESIAKIVNSKQSHNAVKLTAIYLINKD